MADPHLMLARLDAAIAELLEIRAEVLGFLGSQPAPTGNGADEVDDMLDVPSASLRFNYPMDTLRKWARTEGIGRKQGEAGDTAVLRSRV
jgi:hypothetical protein